MSFRIPFRRVNWVTSIFLIGTAFVALTCVPLYLWRYGIDWFQFALFIFYFFATGMSITLGYHRLFSHLAFKARWPVKLFTLIFGACAFENSALNWVSDHRKHHKHVDQDDDPYDISKGFMWAHIGWLFFKLNAEQPMDNVGDLRKDRLVMWQHRWVQWIAVVAGLLLPALLGYFWNGPAGALGGFLLAGIGRVVAVQHCTFFINSLCHCVGKRPYSTQCSARDSAIMALFTFGEGYHNFHHEFQHDYRNGVKKRSFDITKWAIWTLEKVGLVSDLRRVPREKILLAEMIEARRQVDSRLEILMKDAGRSASEAWDHAIEYLHELEQKLSENYEELENAMSERVELSRKAIVRWRQETRELVAHLAYLRRLESALQPA